MIVDFGFDLAGRREPRLWRGAACGAAAAVAEAVPWLELCRVLAAVLDGAADTALAVEAAAVLLVSTAALVALKARANIENFGATYGLVADARLAVADHLGRLPMGPLTRARRAVVAELLAGRFGLYQDVVSQVWGLAVANAALPLVLWLGLLALDWRIAGVVAGFAIAALIAVPWSHRLLARASARLADHRDDLVAGLVEQIEGARELRNYDREGRRRRRVEAALQDFEAAQLRAELAPAPALLAFCFVLQLGFAAAAVAGAALVARGAATPVGLALSLVLALRCTGALADLGINLAELRFAREILGRIRRLAAEAPLPQPSSGHAPPDASISFEGVTFAYDDTGGDGGTGRGAAALDGITGTVPAGGMVALVGPSGAGKSTLAHLVARLWDVDSGAIRIGGVDLRDIPAPALARTVAMVLQDVVLFEGSIADNIRLGRPEATDAAVEAAARAAAAHGFIARLPDGYRTRLGPEAGSLSGGERQRIAIARALLLDAPILVLDEATAQVDMGNEAEIQAGLGALCAGRTILVVAHRLWTVTDADEIWVLDRGRIVQRGPHARLLAEADGLYRRLWDAQTRSRRWRLATAAPAPSLE